MLILPLRSTIYAEHFVSVLATAGWSAASFGWMVHVQWDGDPVSGLKVAKMAVDLANASYAEIFGALCEQVEGVYNES